MRRAIVAVAVAVAAGCGDGRVPTPDGQGPARQTAPAGAKLESTPPKPPAEPETDTGPARFDAADAKRTLRWIVSVTEQSRQPNPKRTRPADQWKAAQGTLMEAVRQTVKWKVTVAGVGGDGTVLFAPFRTTAFPDRSEKHPEITLRIRPWNATQLDSPFACPEQPWLQALRPGQDALTVTGQITGVNTGDLYNWSVALYDVQISPDSDPGTPPAPEGKPPEGFDPGDPDKTFAWFRQQLYPTLDPFGTPGERDRHKKEVTAQFRSLTGTEVHWRWPAAAVNDTTVGVPELVFADYPRQLRVVMSLYLKHPKSSKPLAAGQPTYNKGLLGSPGDKMITPDLIAKIRASSKATVSGKVAKLLFAEAGAYPPRAVEIAVRLDDVLIEP